MPFVLTFIGPYFIESISIYLVSKYMILVRYSVKQGISPSL